MNHRWKRILSLALAAALILALAVPGYAAPEEEEEQPGGIRVSWEKVDAAPRSWSARPVGIDEQPLYGPDDAVRVSIVLDKPSVLAARFSTVNIAQNKKAMRYRDSVRAAQDEAAEMIAVKVLDGKELDVVWNLTLAADAISANVPYAAVGKIKALPGVKDVILETRYEPAADEPNMSVAAGMTGGVRLWASGYTGAGSVVAVIDTGLDTDHELFRPDALEYALEKDGKEAALTAADVEAAWDQLHAAEFLGGSEGVYLNTKVPFAVNYVDRNLEVTHEKDKQGEHGSHVAGIAAANRFMDDGNGGFINALEQVFTQGEAPDAQLIVMKVFGQGGGAYDSDYMVAIEDAILLGADSVNLSLGSSVTGFVTSDGYQAIMESLTECDTVVSISAGNSYDWTYFTDFDYLYSDDVGYHTGGSPGTFTNALTVASVDNAGDTLPAYILLDGETIIYTESTGFGNMPLYTVSGEREYFYLDSPGVLADSNGNVIANEFEDFDLSGMIAVCNRGSSSFVQKAVAAANRGAVATIIVNNTAGTLGMDLSGYPYTNPVVSFTREQGALLKAAGEAVTDGDETVAYTGSLSVVFDPTVTVRDDEYCTMSDFSSWGVPGDLSLKPEITAPGGNIYSVDGSVPGGNGYENMSGTSMAAPQIAGISALLAQYIRENGLQEKTGLTRRALISSLLMSTARPLLEKPGGLYYPVIRQGAGLVDAEAAMNADTYVLMGEDATPAYADGKVKAELGDDPERSGTYSFTFTLNNLTDKELYYTLSADFFTQGIFTYYVLTRDDSGNLTAAKDGEGQPLVADYLNQSVALLDADVSWTADGKPCDPAEAPKLDFNGDGFFDVKDARAILNCAVNGTPLIDDTGADMNGDGEINTYDAYLALASFDRASVTVPADGSVEIGVTVALNDIADYDDCGAYVEGYVFATELDSADGAVGTAHSIPVLGYYGSWSEPAMHDKGSLLEYVYGTEEREPYMAAARKDPYSTETFAVVYDWDDTVYVLGGNPVTWDDVYMPERNSIAGSSVISSAWLSLIRNAAGSLLTVADAGTGELLARREGGSRYAAYYYLEGQAWQNTVLSLPFGFSPAGLEDGTALEVTLKLAPEYYRMEDGSIDWDSVSDESAITLPLVVDSTAPEILSASYGGEAETEGLTVMIGENRYIAYAAVWTEDGWRDSSGEPLMTAGFDPKAEEGAGITIFIPNGTDKGAVDFTDAANTHLMVEVCDYAANCTTYKLNLNTEEVAGGVRSLCIDPEFGHTVPGNSISFTVEAEPWGAGDEVTWSVDDENIAVVDENGVVTGVDEGVAYVTAASVANPEVSATVPVLVCYPEIELNAVAYGADGEAGIIGFNTKDVMKGEEPEVLGYVDADLADLCWSGDLETLYAVTLNGDYTSTLYTMDPDTLALNEIGTEDRLLFLGIAPSLAFPGVTGSDSVSMVSLYGPYLLGIDTETGAYSGVLDFSEYIDGDELVGIAYDHKNSFSYPGLTDYDRYFIVDTDSNLYCLDIYVYLGELYIDCAKLLSFNDPVYVDYYNSLYYDGTNLFWARFGSFKDGIVDLYMVEDIYKTGDVYYLGTFGEEIWPVVGLVELEGVGSGAPERAKTGAAGPLSDNGAASRLDQIIEMSAGLEPAELLDSVEKLERQPIGSLHAVAAGQTLREISGDSEAVAVCKVEITADEACTSGLYTVEYDAGALELVSAESAVAKYSVVAKKEGKVTLGFATLDEIREGSVLLTLTFNLLDYPRTIVTVTAKELNDETPGTVEEAPLGYTFGEPAWTWAEDFSAATAVFTAIEDENVKQTVEATVSSETAEATGEADGKIEYTAVAEFLDQTYTDTQEVAVPFEAPEADWADGEDEETGEEAEDKTDDKREETAGTVDAGPEESFIFPFTDVRESDWFYRDVYDTCRAGLFIGTSDTTFSPYNNVTRAQIVTILYRLDGRHKVDSPAPFPDVAPGAYYADAVAWAGANGIVYGMSDTEFGPDLEITREQFTAIIYRYACYRGLANEPQNSLQGFADKDFVSSWAAEAMSWSCANGILRGNEKQQLDPKGTATRAQAAAIFNRLAKLFAEPEGPVVGIGVKGRS
ncbi:MAG: S8 family serine peptidase [Oscillospiraceae bacterium]|nr:S8 family serine peptidase [Oscillospiraceae bacterium]